MTQFTIDNQKFGVEIEFGGISNATAAKVIANHFGEEAYNNRVIDSKDRLWKIVFDGSVEAQGGQAGELVTPPLLMEDMKDLKAIVTKLKEAGAKIDGSCGMHVHVDISNYSVKTLKNLIKYYAKYEDMFYKASKVLSSRAGYFTKPLNKKHPLLVQKIDSVKNLDDLKILWYGSDKRQFKKHDSSRYSGLNLHNIWYKGWYSGTVEFRFFNSTLEEEEVESYVNLILAISAKALNAKSVNSRKNEVVNDVHLFPKILGGLGIFKKEERMKTTFKFLTKSMREAQ